MNQGDRAAYRSVSLVFLCLVLTGMTPADAQPDTAGYVDDLIAAADRLALDRHPYWRLLLHVQPRWFGVESRVDDPAFFIAPNGKHNPRAELHAMLQAMADPADAMPEDHPAQKFPARTAWLREQLAIDPVRLPPPARSRFDDLWTRLQPEAVTLVFPACHLNNPASMFGHALIVFDSQDRNRLLAQSVSYAGRTDGGFSPWFIVGSFTGAFPGYYSILPYYEMVGQYRDLGARDIWEYELDLTRDELRRMLAHTWELQMMRSDYFFFTENCAFNLLFLVDAARPSLTLTQGFYPWITPIDIVKAIHARGVVRNTVFRPSQVTTLQYLAGRLTRREGVLAGALVAGRMAPETVLEKIGDPDRQIMVLDLASQLTQYRYTTRAMSQETYRQQVLNLLRERSRLARPSDAVYRLPEPSRPETGHDGNRVTLGAGREHHDDFIPVRYRPAYHAVTDAGAGFDAGFQIEFLDTELRLDPATDVWRLEHLDVIDILSVAPRNRFFKPLSWQVKAGLARRRFSEDRDVQIGQGQVGFGYAVRLGKRALAYGLLDARVETGSPYADHYVVGTGPSAGLILAPAHWWNVVLQGDVAVFAGRDEDFASHRVQLRQNLALGRNHSLGVDVWHTATDGYASPGGAIMWNVYF
ncbi:MAG: hypothetical protein A2498_05185 [Lentisphaerae bacterium RIFOXYC12_FULL_60_16]|nr:MAG: hypothetical protein A2498_05185 [Lentisphaerae bacterium RIFOXYC12_FULL_60_16]